MKKLKRGFTLIELMATLAILAIVGTMIGAIFVQGYKVANRASNFAALEDEFRNTLMRIEKNANESTDIKLDNNDTTLIITTKNLDNIKYFKEEDSFVEKVVDKDGNLISKEELINQVKGISFKAVKDDNGNDVGIYNMSIKGITKGDQVRDADYTGSIKVNKNEEITLDIKNTSDDSTSQDSTKLTSNDVVIVLDVNNDMANKLHIIKNSLWNKLLSNNTLRKDNTKYAVVTFSNVVREKIDLTSDVTYLNDNIIKNINVEGSGNNVKNIGETFQSIINILEGKNARPDARKNVIFISQGKINYNNIDLLKNKGYNIISLETDFRKENTLYKMHSDLGALDENYFNINGDYNSIENTIMAQIANRIINIKN